MSKCPCGNRLPEKPYRRGAQKFCSESCRAVQGIIDARIAEKQSEIQAPEEPKIVSVTIYPAGHGYVVDDGESAYRANARAIFDNGEEKTVLAWYDDELTFTKADFIGKTQRQVTALFMERDMAYLRS